MQAALCAVVRQGGMRAALKDIGSDFSDCFSLLINKLLTRVRAILKLEGWCVWKFRMTAQQIKL